MDQVIRVLQILGKMERGGAENMIMNIYRHIDRSRVQFDFVVHTPYEAAFDKEIEMMGGTIYHVPRYKGFNHIKYQVWWHSFFEAYPNYKIVHSHIRSTANIILRQAKAHDCFSIAHSHSTSNGKGVASLVKRLFQKKINNYADARFACSNEAGKWLFGNMPYQIIINAIDSLMFVYDKNKREAIKGKMGLVDCFVIGHVGRFMEAKNHGFLIDVFQQVHLREPRARLLLVGEGPLRQEMECKADALGLRGMVIFTGGREDVPDLMQAMDVFIMPSKYEGLPLALIEAQASGLASIISDTISKEAIITDLVYTLPLSASLTLWVDKVLSYTQGYERRNTRADIIKAHFDIRENAKYMEDFYASIGHSTQGPDEPVRKNER